MGDEQNEQGQVEQEQPSEQEPQSRIVIEFAHPGMAEPQAINCFAVTPGQLHAAARRLQLMADRHVAQLWQRAEMEQARKMAEMAQVQQMLKGVKPA